MIGRIDRLQKPWARAEHEIGRPRPQAKILNSRLSSQRNDLLPRLNVKRILPHNIAIANIRADHGFDPIFANPFELLRREDVGGVVPDEGHDL